MRMRNRGVLWPARLTCGHLRLVSSTATVAGATLCRVCPNLLAVRRIEKVLTLRGADATRPWGVC